MIQDGETIRLIDDTPTERFEMVRPEPPISFPAALGPVALALVLGAALAGTPWALFGVLGVLAACAWRLER